MAARSGGVAAAEIQLSDVTGVEFGTWDDVELRQLVVGFAKRLEAVEALLAQHVNAFEELTSAVGARQSAVVQKCTHVLEEAPAAAAVAVVADNQSERVRPAHPPHRTDVIVITEDCAQTSEPRAHVGEGISEPVGSESTMRDVQSPTRFQHLTQGHQAAVRIQARYRGSKTRRNLRVASPGRPKLAKTDRTSSATCTGRGDVLMTDGGGKVEPAPSAPGSMVVRKPSGPPRRASAPHQAGFPRPAPGMRRNSADSALDNVPAGTASTATLASSDADRLAVLHRPLEDKNVKPVEPEPACACGADRDPDVEVRPQPADAPNGQDTRDRSREVASQRSTLSTLSEWIESSPRHAAADGDAGRDPQWSSEPRALRSGPACLLGPAAWSLIGHRAPCAVHAAAVRIQAIRRGQNTRRMIANLRQQRLSLGSPCARKHRAATDSELEFEAAMAATKIAAARRGQLTRRSLKLPAGSRSDLLLFEKERQAKATDMLDRQAVQYVEAAELELEAAMNIVEVHPWDLDSVERAEEAAKKIQSLRRGFVTRRAGWQKLPTLRLKAEAELGAACSSPTVTMRATPAGKAADSQTPQQEEPANDDWQEHDVAMDELGFELHEAYMSERQLQARRRAVMAAPVDEDAQARAIALAAEEKEAQLEAQRLQQEERIKSLRQSAAANGTQALIGAAQQGEEDILMDILQVASEATLNAIDVGGRSVLHWVAKQGLCAACKVILDDPRFALVNRKHNGGWTALHVAARSGKVEIVRLLLQAPRFKLSNATDNDGRTALHCAAVCGDVDIVECILKHAPFTSVNAMNTGGFTALHIAERYGHEAVCNTIHAHLSDNVIAATAHSRSEVQAHLPALPSRIAKVRTVLSITAPSSRRPSEDPSSKLPGIADASAG